jgi:hypothetical protein
MNAEYTVFSATGEQKKVFMGTLESLYWNMEATDRYVEGNYDHTYYLDGRTLRVRPEMPLTGGDPVGTNEIWRIDGVPPGTTLSYLGSETTVDDNFVEWSSAVPGRFEFNFRNFPYQDVTVYAVIE